MRCVMSLPCWKKRFFESKWLRNFFLWYCFRLLNWIQFYYRRTVEWTSFYWISIWKMTLTWSILHLWGDYLFPLSTKRCSCSRLNRRISIFCFNVCCVHSSSISIVKWIPTCNILSTPTGISRCVFCNCRSLASPLRIRLPIIRGECELQQRFRESLPSTLFLFL